MDCSLFNIYVRSLRRNQEQGGKNCAGNGFGMKKPRSLSALDGQVRNIRHHIGASNASWRRDRSLSSYYYQSSNTFMENYKLICITSDLRVNTFPPSPHPAVLYMYKARFVYQCCQIVSMRQASDWSLSGSD